MIGDLDDFRKRLRLTLPTRWFGETAPLLDAILIGLASMWAPLYALLQFVVQQSRLRTVSSEFLDLAASELVSDLLPRRAQEMDAAYRERLLATMMRSRATRTAISIGAQAAGYSLRIFEAAQPNDTGAYSTAAGLAWNTVGGWGSLQMPLESLAVAYPGPSPYEAELWKNVAHAAPAGGVVWLLVNRAS